MKDLKEKTFTEGRENAPQERDIDEKYNPFKDVSDTDWVKNIMLK